MDIALARVDDRLIHGQVVTAWLQAIGRCDEILICDDKTRNDQFLQQVLQLTAPPNKKLSVLSPRNQRYVDGLKKFRPLNSM